MKKVLVVLTMVVMLGSGCALKTWFCKIDLAKAEATLTQAVGKIQGDYAYWVQARDNLRAAVQANPKDAGAVAKLAAIVQYLGLADQALAMTFGILKDIQKRVCAAEAATAAVEKATEALLMKPVN